MPVLADAVQVCKQADRQILTLYSVLPAKSSAQLDQLLEELLRGKDVQRSIVSSHNRFAAIERKQVKITQTY